jgi:hypothetical protein
MLRKILGWTIFVLIFVFIGFVIWLFFLRDTTTQSSFSSTPRAEDFFPTDIPSLRPDGQTTGDPNRTDIVNRNLIPRLRQLSQFPVAGSIVFERVGNTSRPVINEDGSETVAQNTVNIFRYIERSTGHLYEAREDSLTQTRLSNTTIPKVVDAFFTKDGQKAVLRMIKDDQETIDTLSATIKSKATTSPSSASLIADGFALEGPYLSQNIVDAKISSNGLTYIVPKSAGGSSVITSTFDDLSKRLVFDSPLKDWVVSRINQNKILLTTKADSRVPGFSYLINIQNSAVEKLVGDIPGLTTLMSPDEKWLIYSLSRNNEFNTFVLNTETNETKKFGVTTLPEKCVFSQKNSSVVYCAGPTQMPRVTLPESWYQGTVSLNDNLWKIDLSSQNYEELLMDKEEVDQSFDMTKLEVSPNDEFILFINKKDLTLWSLEITNIVR